MQKNPLLSSQRRTFSLARDLIEPFRLDHAPISPAPGPPGYVSFEKPKQDSWQLPWQRPKPFTILATKRPLAHSETGVNCVLEGMTVDSRRFTDPT
jgi:hypothetical protein